MQEKGFLRGKKLNAHKKNSKKCKKFSLKEELKRVPFRQYALLALTDEYRTTLKDCRGEVRNPEFYEQFMTNEHFVYFGEIPQMPGHSVVAGGTDGKIYVGFHDDDFRELTDEEA